MSEEMTREQAIKWLKTFKGNTGMTELSQAFDVAIAALSAEPCGDAISRQAAIRTFLGKVHDDYPMLSDVMIGILEQLPPVTPKQRTGHWIQKPKYEVTEWNGLDNFTKVVICSECREWEDHKSRYCPSCGAKMENENMKTEAAQDAGQYADAPTLMPGA